MNRVVIKSTAVSHPQRKVTNEELLEEFRGYGQEIGRLMESAGRKERFVGEDDRETPVTLAIEASFRVLKESGIQGKDLDMIIFSSGTPEYLVPTNVSYVHQAIKGKNECVVYDMNANCVGMVVAVEQASRYLQFHPTMKYALVVGAEQMNKYGRSKDPVTKSIFGDAACAVLLEKVEDEGRGILDSAYYTDTFNPDQMRFPKHGLSQAYNEDYEWDERRIFIEPGYDAFVLLPSAVTNIEKLLERNHLSKADVVRYFMTQVNFRGYPLFSEKLGESLEKFEYIGDRYGYTGTSSPFVALHTAIQEGRIKRGDTFVIWSVGAGMTSCSLLCRF